MSIPLKSTKKPWRLLLASTIFFLGFLLTAWLILKLNYIDNPSKALTLTPTPIFYNSLGNLSEIQHLKETPKL